MSGEGLAVTRLAFVFTDLESSTMMYDQLGDMRAFDVVRMHFGLLRESVVRHSGAVVKTIGDAVMATFVEPSDAVSAARDMLARVEEFNASQGTDLIRLKVGIHWGACLAVTLNDRLDYFGQTVNLAARIQSLASGTEIMMSSECGAATRCERDDQRTRRDKAVFPARVVGTHRSGCARGTTRR